MRLAHMYVLVPHKHKRTHRRTLTRKMRRSTLLSINPSSEAGLGRRRPPHGDSPVRLHLARTHQQGQKVNKRQPLNLVPAGRWVGRLEEEF